jgi:hypothetical protein
VKKFDHRVSLLPSHVPKLMNIEPQNAGMNPSISIPSRISPAQYNRSALMKSMNNPNVNSIAGNVINANIGLMNVFKNPMNMDAMIAEKKFFTQIPSMKY